MENSKPHFKYHVFFCTNLRENGDDCCANYNASYIRDYAKQSCKAKKLDENVRINNAGCLGRCEHGPVAVVYPEGIWYTYVDEADIDEIIEEHLIKGNKVERLLIDN